MFQVRFTNLRDPSAILSDSIFFLRDLPVASKNHDGPIFPTSLTREECRITASHEVTMLQVLAKKLRWRAMHASDLHRCGAVENRLSPICHNNKITA